MPSCNLCMCRDRSSNHGIVNAFSSRKLTRLKVRYHSSLFEQETNQNHQSQLSQVLLSLKKIAQTKVLEQYFILFH